MCEFIPAHLNANYDETKSTEAGLGSVLCGPLVETLRCVLQLQRFSSS